MLFSIPLPIIPLPRHYRMRLGSRNKGQTFGNFGVVTTGEKGVMLNRAKDAKSIASMRRHTAQDPVYSPSAAQEGNRLRMFIRRRVATGHDGNDGHAPNLELPASWTEVFLTQVHLREWKARGSARVELSHASVGVTRGRPEPSANQ
jgi:hypothetical protein